MGRKLPFLLCFTLYSTANSKYKSPRGAYNRRGDLTEGFLRYDFGGLIFGGAYFRNFTVFALCLNKNIWSVVQTLDSAINRINRHAADNCYY